MKVLVTGAKGFIGKNLVLDLKNHGYHEILEFDKGADYSVLDEFCSQADFVFHLAGVNRPKESREFMEGNFGFTNDLLNLLKKHNNKAPIMLSSSIQAILDNDYGASKKAGENLLFDYAKETGAPVFVYRFPNVFGKWSRPNYNSVIATFCHNIANDLEITIHNPETELTLVYIDDVVMDLIHLLETPQQNSKKYYEIEKTYSIKLGRLASLLYEFKDSRDSKFIPNMADEFTKKLYSTYLSYLPSDQFKYPLKMNVDERGSFTEFIKTCERGQVSINISKPNITKGNHWHHTKNEKFLVVSGSGVIRFRHIDSYEIIEYYVTGDKLEVLDIPVGYTHNIENLGDTDMVTVMWVNEVFDPNRPDTYFLEV